MPSYDPNATPATDRGHRFRHVRDWCVLLGGLCSLAIALVGTTVNAL